MKLWKRSHPTLWSVSLMVVGSILYFLWGAAFWCSRGWSFLDTVYFSMVTMSTVGYGDYSPSNSAAGQLVTLLFIFVGIFFIFGQLADLVTERLKKA